MTRERFLDWGGHVDARWKFDGTRPVPMTGGSREHGFIVARLLHPLLKRLDGTEWDVLADCGLATIGDKVCYPDLQVTRTRASAAAKLVPDTVVTFEVLSPASVRTDRVDKVREYAAIPSVRRYVILGFTSVALAVMFRAIATTIGR